jgi:hypothetical protein
MQGVNVQRHAEALRPFRNGEFGDDAASPTDAHLKGANDLVLTLRRRLDSATAAVRKAVQRASAQPSSNNLQRMLRLKERCHLRVTQAERVWDFYFELFGQRQSEFGNWLLSCDRIALDCYQHAFLGIGLPRSIPTPPPFTYMRTGFSPATFRRGIPLRSLGRNLNPFPLIQLPYHRLVNPWTLGAILHEVSHNLQNELGLADAIARRIAHRLRSERIPLSIIRVWVRWNREIYADLNAVLLGGPAVVASLMDILARSPETVLHYNSTGPHPTPYIRAFLSFELLQRLGFHDHAAKYTRLWRRMYPRPTAGTIPPPLLASFPKVCRLLIDALCFQPFRELGDKSASQVLPFGEKEQLMIEEAAGRIAQGTDPGVVPERFLIGAARVALSRQLASSDTITTAFYRELSRR